MTLTRRTPLAKVSKKRRAKQKDWELCKKVVWARDRECQGPRLGLDTACSGPLHVHHIRARSRYPELICEPSNCWLLCAACHRRAHDEPKLSKKLGVIAA